MRVVRSPWSGAFPLNHGTLDAGIQTLPQIKLLLAFITISTNSVSGVTGSPLLVLRSSHFLCQYQPSRSLDTSRNQYMPPEILQLYLETDQMLR